MTFRFGQKHSSKRLTHLPTENDQNANTTFGLKYRRFRLGMLQRFGSLPGMYESTTIQYPPGINCILTSEDEININNWLSDDTGEDGSSNLTVATGELKTVIGIYYPGFYTGPIGNWSEALIREKVTNGIEEAIYNWSNTHTKLVGPNGGQVMIDGPRKLVGTIPNTNGPFPCNQHGSTGAIGQANAALTAACPTCDVRTALILACPDGGSQVNSQPPGGFLPLRGYGGSPTNSTTWTDGMVGYNGDDATGGGCGQAPGVDVGGYIAEDDIELPALGRVKLVMLHEIMHTLGWPHTSKPMVASQWCPTYFAQNGPQLPCTDTVTNYLGQDNLCPMAYGAYCQNPYNVYDTHPTASTKYLRGLGLAPSDDGTWLPDNAVLSLDLSPGQTETVRLYAHDTKATIKEDTLRDIATGATGGAFIVDPTTGEGVIPYLIRIKRPVDFTQSSDNWPVDEKDLFISYRMNAWYNLKNQSAPDTGDPNTSEAYWTQGGYLNGAVIMDWGPVNIGNKPGVLSLYKYDAEDVRSPSAAPNQTLEGYIANGNAYPKLELRILENVGSVPVNARNGPVSILVQIKAL